MKKLFTIACTLVIGGALAFAQAGRPAPAATSSTTKTSTTSTKTSGKKSHQDDQGAQEVGRRAKKAPAHHHDPSEITSWKLLQKSGQQNGRFFFCGCSAYNVRTQLFPQKFI